MEIYLIFVIILIILAVIDLTVGVANDAVNFLNSAVGAHAAPLRTILIFASIGILCGVTLSGGMMEVARKGVFNPSFFTLSEVLIIFVALMIQDVVLLDLFNAYGMPTSTTITMIFGLLGGSLAVGLLKLGATGQDYSLIFNYINSANVLLFASAILVSIVLAFTVSAIVQYITRFIFTFNYKPNFKKIGSIWAGVALTSLSYFLIIKGLKGATFLTVENTTWIAAHTKLILLILLVFWSIFTQCIMWFTNYNVLKFIVLFGTFALALAFAANDLVNFMGAPIAGLMAYNHIAANTELINEPLVFLNGKVHIETWLMLVCGGIMVATLFLSKKSKTVIETSLNLTKQTEGFEQFESNYLARIIVRMSLNASKVIKNILPKSIVKYSKSRFDTKDYIPEVNEKGEKQSFDLIRASVILMVSAALISLGTSFKLPLSTTYVTFIVAMAAALPDKAWGRDSAVYRVAGVINVIGGWFLTAFSAAFLAMIVAIIIYFGGVVAAIVLFAGSIYLLYKNSLNHKTRELEKIELRSKYSDSKVQQNNRLNLISEDLIFYLGEVRDIFHNNYLHLKEENLLELKKNKKRAKKTNDLSNAVMAKILTYMKKENDADPELHYNLSKLTIALQEIYDRLSQVTNQCFNYVDNNHVSLVEIQMEEFNQIVLQFQSILDLTIKYIATNDEGTLTELAEYYKELNNLTTRFNKNQIKRVKKATSNVRRSMLYISLLNDAERISESCKKICDSIKNIQNEVEIL